ncbi:hypothetical protein Tco_1236307 [Tanacetum coccineum]
MTMMDDGLGILFFGGHPNTIHTPVRKNVELKDILIMGEGILTILQKTETISVETLVSNPNESDDFSLGECNLFDIDDSYYEKSKSRLAHLCSLLRKIVKIVDISSSGEEIVESYLLIKKINAFSLSPPLPISPIFCPSSTIPVVDFDLPLEEADVPSFSDDSMILSEYESFTFDDEPVMAEVNVFDEINTSELSYPGIGENDVLDEEEDTFTYTTRSFLPFVTYPEVLPASYSTGSEDKIFNPGKDKKRQKEAKTIKKPTRNGKDKTRVKNATQSKPDQPDTARKESQ